MSTNETFLSSLGSAPKIIVAIDGPAGAGKSTIARHLARHFGLLNLETGAMYRAFGLKALRTDLPLDQSAALGRLAAETTIRLEPGNDENRVLLDEEDVTGLIRNPEVTDAASRVSVFPAIRSWIVRLQSSWAPRVAWSWRAATSAPWFFPMPRSRSFWMPLLKCGECAVSTRWSPSRPCSLKR